MKHPHHRRPAIASLIACAVTLLPAVASADSVAVSTQPEAVGPAILPFSGSAPNGEPPLVPPLDKPTTPGAAPKHSYWEGTKPRWFVSGNLEGGVYLKPQIRVGYGQPHWMWVGIEAYPVITPGFAGGYAGIRGTLPVLDLRFGVRDSFSFDRSYLTPKASYVAADVDHAHDHARSHYMTIEGGITGVVPLPGSFLVANVDAYYLPDVPKGLDVYEESLRVVARPNWVIGNRLAYAVKIGKSIKAGALGELVVVPGRDAVTWRVGPAACVSITDHLDGMFALTVPVSSPDHLGLMQGAFGVLGLSYAWATGDERPHFP
jgi:hypothetical protein